MCTHNQYIATLESLVSSVTGQMVLWGKPNKTLCITFLEPGGATPSNRRITFAQEVVNNGASMIRTALDIAIAKTGLGPDAIVLIPAVEFADEFARSGIVPGSALVGLVAAETESGAEKMLI